MEDRTIIGGNGVKGWADRKLATPDLWDSGEFRLVDGLQARWHTRKGSRGILYFKQCALALSLYGL